jgi:hypothetical protein
MATTMYFEEVVSDKQDKALTLDLEVGRSSYYRENLIYLRIGDDQVILDAETGRRLCEAIASLAAYLHYD